MRVVFAVLLVGFIVGPVEAQSTSAGGPPLLDDGRPVPVAPAVIAHNDRGVTVRLILDMKANESPDDGNPATKGFPRDDNEDMVNTAGIPVPNIIRREARPNNIQHNKFMVLLKGASKAPKQVWTGSTNISDGGIYGQTNVGHWIRDSAIAKQYLA